MVNSLLPDACKPIAFLLPVVSILTSALISVIALLTAFVPVTVIPSARPAVLLTLIFNLFVLITVCLLLLELIADKFL